MKKLAPMLFAGLFAACASSTTPKTTPKINKVEPKTDKLTIEKPSNRIVIIKCEHNPHSKEEKSAHTEDSKVLYFEKEGDKLRLEHLTIDEDFEELKETKISDDEYMIRYDTEGSVAINLKANTIFIVRGFSGYKRRIKRNLRELMRDIKQIAAVKNDKGIIIHMIGPTKYVQIQVLFTPKSGYYGTYIKELELYQ